MCGICGIYDYRKKAAIVRTTLVSMAECLTHRGPDDEGYYIHNNIGLGHTRLAIIDLNTGHQPIHNEDKTISVILNGEIYNYKELRQSLTQKGHVFTTGSDTEVIVHAYESYGIDFLDHIDGMFAIALWDEPNQSLFLIRDRVGKKPLYYTNIAGSFYFSSEIKSFLKVPGFEQGLNAQTLCNYSVYSYCPPPATIFKDVSKVLPAHYITVTETSVTSTPYWKLQSSEYTGLTKGEAQKTLHDLLFKSIKKRMHSDVPIGAFLSGGLDSSIIVALMSEFSSKPIKTFSIGFNEDNYSELPYARSIAKKFKTDHYEEIVTPKIDDILDDYIYCLDQPFADSSSIAAYYLSRMTRKHVTVALSGDGGDESFGGYPRYKAMLLYQLMRNKPFLKNMFISIAQLLLTKDTTHIDSKSYKIKLMKFSQCLKDNYPSLVAYNSWFCHFSPESLHELFKTPGTLCNLKHLAQYYDRASNQSSAERTLYTDIHTYLPDDLLFKMDSMSMAHSLEVRSPFLDHHFIEFVSTLPLQHKVSLFNSKIILKETYKDYIPKAIINRKKMGFGVPISKWFRHDLKPLLRHVLNVEAMQSRGIYNAAHIETLVNEHISGKSNNAYPLWNVFIFELWCQKFIDGKTL